jgi:hypothetical protein
MENSRTLALFGMIACCVLVASVRTNAQSVTGFTDLSYDDLTNTVIAYSETDTDYDVGGDYTAYVNLVVRDDNLNVVASGTRMMVRVLGTPPSPYSSPVLLIRPIPERAHTRFTLSFITRIGTTTTIPIVGFFTIMTIGISVSLVDSGLIIRGITTSPVPAMLFALDLRLPSSSARRAASTRPRRRGYQLA